MIMSERGEKKEIIRNKGTRKKRIFNMNMTSGGALVMAKKIIGIMLLIVLCGALFAACKEPEEEQTAIRAERIFWFTRKVISSEPEVGGLKGAILESAKTRGSKYVYENPKTGREYLKSYDYTYPEQVKYIVKDQKRLEEIFDDPPEVDFASQMVIVIFATTMEQATYQFKRVTLEGKKMIVETEVKYYAGDWDHGQVQYVSGYVVDRMVEVLKTEMRFVGNAVKWERQ